MCSLKCLLDIKMEMSSRLEVNISRDFGERFKLEINWKVKTCHYLDGIKSHPWDWMRLSRQQVYK